MYGNTNLKRKLITIYRALLLNLVLLINYIFFNIFYIFAV